MFNNKRVLSEAWAELSPAHQHIVTKDEDEKHEEDDDDEDEE